MGEVTKKEHHEHIETKKEMVISIIMITCGAVVAALAVEEFLTPNNIFDGGVVGVSMILSHVTGFKLGLLTVIINIPFLLIAWKNIGHVFILKAGYAMALFSVCLTIFEDLPPIVTEEQPILATAFGGVMLGIGVGFVLRGGGCLDGTEIVGILINKKFSLSVGNVVMIINIVVYSAAGIMFGIVFGLYSMLMYFISSRIIDMIEVGLEQDKSVMIITEHGEMIADEIYQNFGRTVTFLHGEGFISGTDKDVLYCVITRAEVHDFRTLITDLDYAAFTTFTDVAEVIGHKHH
ncbi:MAG: YitT family protein [Eubacterium sp.]|nr:YitT family protein [Eubacterium sp.]